MLAMTFLHEHLDCGILSCMDNDIESKLELVGENKINLHFQCVWNVKKNKKLPFLLCKEHVSFSFTSL